MVGVWYVNVHSHVPGIPKATTVSEVLVGGWYIRSHKLFQYRVWRENVSK